MMIFSGTPMKKWFNLPFLKALFLDGSTSIYTMVKPCKQPPFPAGFSLNSSSTSSTIVISSNPINPSKSLQFLMVKPCQKTSISPWQLSPSNGHPTAWLSPATMEDAAPPPTPMRYAGPPIFTTNWPAWEGHKIMGVKSARTVAQFFLEKYRGFLLPKKKEMVVCYGWWMGLMVMITLVLWWLNGI